METFLFSLYESEKEKKYRWTAATTPNAPQHGISRHLGRPAVPRRLLQLAVLSKPLREARGEATQMAFLLAPVRVLVPRRGRAGDSGDPDTGRPGRPDNTGGRHHHRTFERQAHRQRRHGRATGQGREGRVLDRRRHHGSPRRRGHFARIRAHPPAMVLSVLPHLLPGKMGTPSRALGTP